MNLILVTGGCGFIGANFIQYMFRTYPHLSIVNLDKLTYAGNPDNLKNIAQCLQYRFIKGDICDQGLVTKLFQEYPFDAVVHFAAESHVDRSITGPEIFIITNVLGTQILLEAAKAHWQNQLKNKRFVYISTDEVYGSLGDKGYFTEHSPIAPNSPYSASKAGADLLARSYAHTFGFPALVTRCSNNYGPYQHVEKLIPLMISNALHDKPLPVYGDGKNIRDWIFVEDHCRAIDLVLQKGKVGEAYNVGGNNEWQNIQIVEMILSILNKPKSLIQYVKDRPGHDRRYAIDASKISQELGWQPRTEFQAGLRQTIEWYLKMDK
ncbi:MAG: dTDP-glucose 4,6-dehydratase [Candidatus Brocadiae bacterium]|nr:dTDP-glucose 4,6-dehydratase [Candidatus Brocadiia bacterium]